MSQPRNIMILAGEASGDLHGARLVDAVRTRRDDVSFCGMGSAKLRAVGVDLLVDSSRIAVVGLVEVLRHWPEIKRALKTIEDAITRTPPDLLILIDYVEFNLRIAAVAKRLGVRVLFYVSPQIWAWRPERIHKIGALVDKMAVIFPFEVELYEKANVPVAYVGHPLVGHVTSTATRESLGSELRIPAQNKLIGLLPGSRGNEIQNILPVLLDAACDLNEDRSDLSFVLPLAPGVSRMDVERQLRKRNLQNVHLLDKRAYDVMASADCIAIASGTATLEAALMEAPMVIVYRVSALSWLWMKRKLTISRVGLANIVAQRPVVPELIQSDCRRDRVADELRKLLEDNQYAERMRIDLAETKALLGTKDTAVEVAKLVDELLKLTH
ncbi:MAG: lipid-A-disaccharide synthase [Pseudomonadota bacterium]